MLKRLAKETMVYGLGHISQQLLALLTLPIFARLLTPTDYGLIETVGTVTVVLGIVASMQLTGGMHRYFFQYHEQDPQRAISVMVTAIAFVVALDLVLLALVWPWCESIMRYLQGGPGSGSLLQAGLINLMALTVLAFLQEVHRLKHRPWHFVGISLAGALIWMGMGLYFVYFRQGGVLGYLWGGAYSVLLTLPLAWWGVRRDLRGAIRLDDLQQMLRYSLPWIPTAASAWLMSLADRLVLNQWVGLDEIGYYGIAQKVTRVLTYATVAFGSAWSPFIFGLYAKDPEQERVVRAEVTTTYLFGLSAVAVAVTAVAPWLIALLASDAFLPAAHLVGPLCLGIVGFGISNTLSTGICLIAQTGYVAAFTGICGVLNISLNFLLVPWWGAAGSAWATAVSYVVLNVLYYRKTQQLIPTPFAVRRLVTTTVLTIAAVALLGLAASLLLRLTVLVAYLALVWVLGGIDRDQVRAQAREMVRYLRQRLTPAGTGGAS